MQTTLDDQDYQEIADKVMALITEKYELVPRQNTKRFINLAEFRQRHGIRKSPAWCRLFLLPEIDGVAGLNEGKGHAIIIDDLKATQWLDEHTINWGQRLP